MEWHKPKDRMPEQGKKILCFLEGDVYVGIRFGKIWSSYPDIDSMCAIFVVPDLWSEIDLPGRFRGYVLFQPNHKGPHLTLDQLELHDEAAYDEIMRMHEDMVKKMKEHQKIKIKEAKKRLYDTKK